MSVNLLIKLLIVVVPCLQVLVVLFVKLFVLINLLCNLLYNLLHISPNVVNKTIPSVDASETFCTIVKSKSKVYEVWIQYLILFSLVTLKYGYLSFNIDCYHLKANSVINNLAAYLIFIEYLIYNFCNCLCKIFLNVLFFYSKIHQCFLISIYFSLVFKPVSILSFTKSQFACTFFTMFGIFRKSLLFGSQKGSGKTEKLCRDCFNTLLGKSNYYFYFQHVYKHFKLLFSHF